MHVSPGMKLMDEWASLLEGNPAGESEVAARMVEAFKADGSAAAFCQEMEAVLEVSARFTTFVTRAYTFLCLSG